MKKLMTLFAFLMIISISAQMNNSENSSKFTNVKVENLKINIEVDSLEELLSTFTVEDVKEVLNEMEDDQELVFKVTCHEKKISNDFKQNISFEIKGSSNDKEGFFNSVEKIRSAVIKYYKSK